MPFTRSYGEEERLVTIVFHCSSLISFASFSLHMLISCQLTAERRKQEEAENLESEV